MVNKKKDAGARLDLEDIKYKNQLLSSKIFLMVLEKFLKNGANPHHKNIAGKSQYNMVIEV